MNEGSKASGAAPEAAWFSAGNYAIRFAQSAEDVERIQRLRFSVFNLEMGEGLDAAYASGRDVDEFDAVCRHLMVTHQPTGDVVGTYRLQTYEMAAAGRGFYTAGEFDLAALPPAVLARSIELGRACISREHRNGRVLFLLWRALTAFMAQADCRYFFGCSSLTSQDPDEGRRVYDFLESTDLLHPDIRVAPLPGFECIAPGAVDPPGSVVMLPKLMQLYFNYGVRACGPPAIDRIFKTIDFFVLFDRESIGDRQRRVLFGS